MTRMADKGRNEMNKKPIGQEFSIKAIADAIGDDKRSISWMFAGLVKSKHLGKRTEPLTHRGGTRSFYWRLKHIDIARIKAKKKVDGKELKLYDGTKDPWYQFVCGSRL